MNKKLILPFILVATLGISFLGIADYVKATPELTVKIDYPSSGENCADIVSFVVSARWVNDPGHYVGGIYGDCYIDNQYYSDFGMIVTNNDEPKPSFAIGGTTLFGLSIGEHNLKIKGTAYIYDNRWTNVAKIDFSDEVTFYVDHKLPSPTVTIISPDQFTEKNVAVNILTNLKEAIVTYRLDDFGTMTIIEAPTETSEGYLYNVTLGSLPNGQHTIIANAKGSTTATVEKTFTVNAQTPQKTSTQTEKPAAPNSNATDIYVIISVVCGFLIGFIMLLIFKKRRYKKTTVN